MQQNFIEDFQNSISILRLKENAKHSNQEASNEILSDSEY